MVYKSTCRLFSESRFTQNGEIQVVWDIVRIIILIIFEGFYEKITLDIFQVILSHDKDFC